MEGLAIPQVKIEVFEGPLDLLLTLVKEEELDVRRIPISRILADFLRYLEMMETVELEVWSDYLLMAATLIYIKSRMLLPSDEEEVFDEEGERAKEELVRKLVEYKRFKEASSILEDMLERQMDVFMREGEEEEGGTLFEIVALVDAFVEVMKRFRSKPPGHEIELEGLRIEDFMDAIMRMVADRALQFEDMMAGYRTRMEMVVAFLALLELIRRGLVWVRQEAPYGAIWIGAR
jgi:segregation and condensation protein A